MRTFASVKQLAQRFSVHTSTIWRWTQAGLLPEPHRLTPGVTRWDLAEVDDYEQRLLAESQNNAA